MKPQRTLRRKKRRGVGGEITLPVDVTAERLQQIAKEKVESGEYTIGQRIVPRKVNNLNILNWISIGCSSCHGNDAATISTVI